jgi:multiple sugar transport system substrate-binding protein
MMRKNKGSTLTKGRGSASALAVAFLLTGVLGLAACGSGDAANSAGDGGPVTLELWDTDTRPERTENLKKLISMFEEENPSIKVNYLGLPTDSYMQKISTAIATKATPDIITPKASDISALVAQKALAPLDEKFEGAGWDDKISQAMTSSQTSQRGSSVTPCAVGTASSHSLSRWSTRRPASIHSSGKTAPQP